MCHPVWERWFKNWVPWQLGLEELSKCMPNKTPRQSQREFQKTFGAGSWCLLGENSWRLCQNRLQNQGNKNCLKCMCNEESCILVFRPNSSKAHMEQRVDCYLYVTAFQCPSQNKRFVWNRLLWTFSLFMYSSPEMTTPTIIVLSVSHFAERQLEQEALCRGAVCRDGGFVPFLGCTFTVADIETPETPSTCLSFLLGAYGEALQPQCIVALLLVLEICCEGAFHWGIESIPCVVKEAETSHGTLQQNRQT